MADELMLRRIAQLAHTRGLSINLTKAFVRLSDTLGKPLELWTERDTIEEALIDEIIQRYNAATKIQRCAANMHSDPPSDCDAPFCGCNPEWTKVIEALQECGWKSPDELRREQQCKS